MNPPNDALQRNAAAVLAAEYEILRPLGQGGMATVYLARERSLKRLVALKVLDPALGASPIFRSRFEREVESAAQLHHPNIVSIFRFGAIEGTAYYAMAYVEGESLADRMRREGRLRVADALRIAREIADALGAAHRRGIVHRDIKPQNVLLDRESGRALVTDFGICAVLGDARTPAPDAEDADRLTGLGMVMGTPRYMSPEQASGERDLTPASDLYSLGLLLYEMIAGAYPYAVGTPPNYMLAHVTRPVVPLVSRVGDVPLEVETLVMRLLAKEPRERFASAEEAIAAIDAAAADVPGLTRGARALAGARRGARRRFGGRRLAALLVGLVVVAAAAMFGLQSDDAAEEDPRKSVLIGFFQNLTGDPSLEWLRLGGVEYLAQSLGRWEDLRVIDPERLLDLARRAELPADAVLSREDALRLARAADVRTATIGTILPLSGDTLGITIRVYDVESGSLLTTGTARAVGDTALPRAFTVLADHLLQLAGAPTGALAEREPPTRSLDAYRAYIEGIEARSRWDFPEAIAAFRRAVAEDPEFAMAYYELSLAVLATEGIDRDAPFVALADSALRYAAVRPPRERMLIEAYHTLLHADLPRAREQYQRLLTLDSTIADAWTGLGDAAWLDVTLRTDAQGREYLPANHTLALRAYERALALDANDHRIYPQMANLLLGASLEQDRAIAAFREPPPGTIQTISLRSPARYYGLLLVGDSLIAVPSESLTVRYSQQTIDSLRARARERARALLQRWLSIAPDEGQAHLWLMSLQQLDRDYEGALASLTAAERYGAGVQVPFPIVRLGLLLSARRWDAAAQLGDSLARGEWGPEVPPQRALTAGPVANWLLAAGRVDEALRLVDRYFATVQTYQGTPAIQREISLLERATPLRVRATLGGVTRQDVARTVAELEGRIAAAPAAERDRLRTVVSWSVIAAAALTGDTALLAEWRRVPERSSRRGLDAVAALIAGDEAGAARLYDAAVSDTSRSALHVFGLARTAEGLGRTADARRWYAKVDSLTALTGGPGVDPDWVLVPEAYARQAAAAEALGMHDEARTLYRRVLDLWRDADPALRDERAAVARALGELDRADAPDRPSR